MRATKWYCDAAKNSAKRVFRSIIRPWPLEFEDIKKKIDKCFQRLQEQAAVAHHAETRDLTIKVSEIYQVMCTNRSSLQEAFGTDTSQLQRAPSVSVAFDHKQVNAYLCVPIDPQKTLQVRLAMRNRQHARGEPRPRATGASAFLNDWISTPTSSLVRLKGLNIRPEEARNVALDVIEQLQSRDTPVI